MGLHDECGVAGIFNAENSAALTYFALTSLQHRGQESAGIAVSDGTEIHIHKDMGLVNDVFEHNHFEALKGNIAVGHVRYALAHNGQLVNYEPLREMLEDAGNTFSSTSDTEVILKLIARNYKKGLENAVVNTIQLIKGSYALCLMTEDTLIGVRDPNGIRPLCLGKITSSSTEQDSSGSKEEKTTYILASESCAIDSVNGEFVRDIQPGEIIIITKDGIKSILLEEKTKKQTCIFEYVYFARPDSVIH